jgi:hypothetical protein
MVEKSSNGSHWDICEPYFRLEAGDLDLCMVDHIDGIRSKSISAAWVLRHGYGTKKMMHGGMGQGVKAKGVQCAGIKIYSESDQVWSSSHSRIPSYSGLGWHECDRLWYKW